ncbi:MAG: hypothetical protein FWF24_02270 [Alphaproteobacteria bacterium]|nr:hypothetical protein [Alphaproteobacteria bacterium]
MNATLPFRHFKQRLAYHRKLTQLHDKAIPLVLELKERRRQDIEEKMYNFHKNPPAVSEMKTLQDNIVREVQRGFKLRKNWDRLLGDPAWYYSVLYKKLPEHKASLKVLTSGFQTLGKEIKQDIRHLEQKEEEQRKKPLYKLGFVFFTVPTVALAWLTALIPENKRLPVVLIAASAVMGATIYRHHLKDLWKKTMKELSQKKRKNSFLSPFSTPKENPAASERKEKPLGKKNVSSKLKNG